MAGRRENSAKSKSLTISTTPQVLESLHRIASSGLYGKNPAEVASRFIDEKVREVIGEEQLRRILRDFAAPPSDSQRQG